VNAWRSIVSIRPCDAVEFRRAFSLSNLHGTRSQKRIQYQRSNWMLSTALLAVHHLPGLMQKHLKASHMDSCRQYPHAETLIRDSYSHIQLLRSWYQNCRHGSVSACSVSVLPWPYTGSALFEPSSALSSQRPRSPSS
jgi:hypothetical protein